MKESGEGVPSRGSTISNAQELREILVSVVGRRREGQRELQQTSIKMLYHRGLQKKKHDFHPEAGEDKLRGLKGNM